MNTQKVETCALSDDELDAVSGGDAISEQAKLNAIANAQQIAEDKKAGEALKGFQQALQELP
jgi:hypothetical protein